MRHKYTIEYLMPFIQNATSFRHLIQLLGLQETGGNYSHLQRVAKKLGIDTSHFTGKGWRANKQFGKKYPIEDYLNGLRFVKSDDLKKRLIEEGYFEHQCQRCKLTEWLNQPIPLELHHKDRNHSNNQLTNLEILCSNCHSIEHKVPSVGLAPTLDGF